MGPERLLAKESPMECPQDPALAGPAGWLSSVDGPQGSRTAESGRVPTQRLPLKRPRTSNRGRPRIDRTSRRTALASVRQPTRCSHRCRSLCRLNAAIDRLPVSDARLVGTGRSAYVAIEALVRPRVPSATTANAGAGTDSSLVKSAKAVASQAKSQPGDSLWHPGSYTQLSTALNQAFAGSSKSA